MEQGHSSHDAFKHDSLNGLGYDWEWIADHDIGPKAPLKVYLPRSTDDVVAAIKDEKALSPTFRQKFRIRSMGHSSNDLVLADKGTVLCTDKLNKMYEPDIGKKTIRFESGVALADLDKFLNKFGLGLPIIGDNNHITAGGFASVGGISPASHRFGLFVDNVLAIEYVDWAGNIRHCGWENQPDELKRVLTGTGRHGVITELTCQLYSVDKFRTIIHNQSQRFSDVDAFMQISEERVTNPDRYLFHRGMWTDTTVRRKNRLIGQFCSYSATAQNPYTRLRKKLAYGYLHFLGKYAGRLPKKLDEFVRLLGILGVVVFPPRYGSIKDVESLTDTVIDYSVGEPSRMLTVLAPVAKYRVLFEKIYALCRKSRAQHHAITGISIYVKPIKSDYLKADTASAHYVELTFLFFIDSKKMTTTILDELVSQIDNLCIEHGALRYMPTKTSKDEATRKQIDPNFRYPQA
jgi:hypothetical protein